MRRTSFFAPALVAGIGFAWAPGAHAQAAPGTTSVSAAITGIHQFTANLDHGGDAKWSSASLSGGVTRQFSVATSGGISARYAFEDWRFGSPTAFAGEAPWKDLHRATVGISVGQALSHTVLVIVSPSIEWAHETDADIGDALIYGAVVSAVKVVSPGRVVGLGASVYRKFYSVKVSPFVVVNWKLSDRLKLANALPAGPEGGAGVELRYQISRVWESAAGGVYRSDRTRLGKAGRYAGDVGETSFIPLFVRLTRRLGARSSVDVYGGAFLNGRIRVKTSGGDEIVSDDFSTAPAVAVTLSIKS